MLDKFFSLQCPDCGGKISEDDEFCPSCGVDLESSLDFDEREVMAEEYFDKAMAICNSGKSLERALENIDLAIQFNPEYSEAHNLCGIILDLMNRKQSAISAYKEAIRLDPHNSDAIENLQELVGSNYRDVIDDLPNPVHDGLVEDEDKDAVILEGQEAVRRNPYYLDEIENLPEIEYEEPVRKVKSAELYSNYDTWIGSGFLRVALFIGVLSLSIWGLYRLYQNFGRDFLLPKQTIVFQPDYAQIDNATLEDFESAAQTLTERAKALGYASVIFSVEDEQIIGKVPASVDVNAMAEKISPIGLLEFVDFRENPMASGSEIVTDFRSSGDGTEVWHTVMTNGSVENASVTQDQVGNYQIAFSLTGEGSEIFAKHTSENVGTYLGIVLEKEVISAPRIQSKITGGQGVVTGQFTYEKAAELAAIMKTTALPFPIEYIGGSDAVE